MGKKPCANYEESLLAEGSGLIPSEGCHGTRKFSDACLDRAVEAISSKYQQSQFKSELRMMAVVDLLSETNNSQAGYNSNNSLVFGQAWKDMVMAPTGVIQLLDLVICPMSHACWTYLLAHLCDIKPDNLILIRC